MSSASCFVRNCAERQTKSICNIDALKRQVESQLVGACPTTFKFRPRFPVAPPLTFGKEKGGGEANVALTKDPLQHIGSSIDFRYQVLGEERGGGGGKPRVIAGGGGSHMAKKVLLSRPPSSSWTN